ncbi:putative Repressor protein c2, partial [Pseudomonas savastanoi pv. glycinea]
MTKGWRGHGQAPGGVTYKSRYVREQAVSAQAGRASLFQDFAEAGHTPLVPPRLKMRANENGLLMQAVRRTLNALRAVALLEFLVAAARARIVATHIFQGVAHRFLVGVPAVRTVHMAMLVVVMIVIMVVVAIGAMNMGLLVHRFYSANKSGAHYPANRDEAVSAYFDSHMIANLSMLIFSGVFQRLCILMRRANLMTRQERIARAIAASGMKKGEIAAQCGVANSAVTQWISGESKSLRPENLYALARATGFRAEWL